jgi:nitrate/nitrite-specific signal transduction histidine kinase
MVLATGRLIANISCALLAMLLSLPAFSAGPQDELIAKAINVAGRQRMLSQRMVKAWALIGLGNVSSQPASQLAQASEAFEANLATLAAVVEANPSLLPAMQNLRERWAVLRDETSRESRREHAAEVLNAGEAALHAAESLVARITSLSAHDEARLINVCGRQRMLSQRLVKAYAYLAWGLDSPAVMAQFVGSWNEMEAAMQELHSAPENTPVLTAVLADAQTQWGWLKSALSLYRENAFYPGIMDDAGENMLLAMDRATHLYEALLSARDGS